MEVINDVMLSSSEPLIIDSAHVYKTNGYQSVQHPKQQVHVHHPQLGVDITSLYEQVSRIAALIYGLNQRKNKNSSRRAHKIDK